MNEHEQPARDFKTAVLEGRADRVRELFAVHPGLSRFIDSTWFAFGRPALAEAAGREYRELCDVLLDLGADPDARSRWENGPYTALHTLVDGATPARLELAEHLAARGATVDLHAAAGMGRLDRIEEILDESPDRVSEPGPDGATPLHLARTPEVAALLLDRGAEIDKRCVDHRSTPAMWAAGGREDVVRFLLERGAKPDLYQAVLLGDLALLERIVEADSEAIGVRVRFGGSHPHLGSGDKYVWALNGADTPLELAYRRGETEIERWLEERCPAGVRLVHASRRGDAETVRALVEGSSTRDAITEEDLYFALCGSGDGARALLRAGVDPDIRHPANGNTALHHAAWEGDAGLMRALLEGGADPTIEDGIHASTPTGWADYAGRRDMVELLGRFQEQP